jgi:glycosyltransferase involved in cell wall biosynthesis
MALVVDAFAKMPDRRLIVIGDGPEFEKVKARATPNITLLGYQPNDVLVAYMQRAKAFVFAAEEDFGIAPVEAQACGTPVIAFGKGGALETVIDSPDPARRTGVFFRRQQTDDIVDAVRRFEANGRYDPAVCRQHALQFSAARFRQQFTELVELACGVAPERDSTIVPLQPRAAAAPKSGAAEARAQSFDAAASWSDEERKSWI